jgi:hypothetical protein
MLLSGLNAEAVGFEPTEVLPSLVFKTSALIRSAMLPCLDMLR